MQHIGCWEIFLICWIY